MSEQRDSIHIEQLEVLGRVGVTENERSHPQRLVFNVTVWLRQPFSQLADDIAETANYSVIAHQVRVVTEDGSHRLIETLADAVARRLIESFPVAKVRVELRKFVLPGSAFVAVTAQRESS